MNAIQLVANGTEINSRKNENILSRKIFLNEKIANDYKDEFYGICTNPIEGYTIYLDPNEPVEIDFMTVEVVKEA